MTVKYQKMSINVRNELVQNELVCFLQQKSKILPFDDLVTIVTDFYSVDEVKEAVTNVYAYLEKRPPAYNGHDKERKFVADILKLVLNPNTKLPKFVAVDISRLPPVGVEHLDVSALLQEMQLLRNEVRAVGAIRKELEEMKAAVRIMQQVAMPSPEHDNISDGEYSNSVPPTSAVNTNPNEPTVAQRLKLAIQSGRIDHVKSAKDKSKVVIGKSTTSQMKSVPTYRNIDLFVARVHPMVPDTMIKECVQDALKSDSNDDERKVVVNCEKLATKYESYHSYHVTVTVDTVIFHDAISRLMASEVWPSGLLVRRFFKKKNNNVEPEH